MGFIKKQLLKVAAVWKKNLSNHLANKKKILGQLFFPCFISFIYYTYKQSDQEVIVIIFQQLLLFYLALVSSSTIREIITLFITEREEGYRQHQMVSGMPYKAHTVGNMSYMNTYTLFFLLPLFIVMNVQDPNLLYLFNFMSLVLPQTALIMFLTSFFTDHKIASQIISLLLFLSSILPLFYNPEGHRFLDYLAEFIPNSAFSISIMAKISEDEKFSVSLKALSLTKIYIILYGFIEFREQTLLSIKHLCAKLCRCFKKKKTQEVQVLKEEIEMASYQEAKMENKQSAIVIKRIVKTYGDMNALNEVSTTIYKSEIFGLLGRNGSGKTTLVDIITKVKKPTSGTFTIVDKQEKNIKIGICYQHEILYENLTVKQHIQFYSYIKELEYSEDNWNSIVESLGIEEEMNKKAKELSGGNKRKLSIALALLARPDLLIFDEPTSGLDPISRRNIWKILQEIKQTKSTVILTTHHLDETDYLSDRICIIEKGNIIEESSPQQIKNKYGKGHYLIIHHDTFNDNGRFDSAVYCKMVDSLLPNAKFLQSESDFLKYFINQETQIENLLLLIEKLQIIDGIKVSFRPNSLEQSFISTIQEHSQSYESEGVVEENFRSEVKKSNFKQMWGILLKNFYCFKGKFFFFYLVSILMVICGRTISYILRSKFKDSEEDEDPQNEENENKIRAGIFLIQSFMLLASAFLSIPVYEKQKKIISLLKTRGLKAYNYWIGHGIFDLMLLLINLVVLRIIFMNDFPDLPFQLIFLTGVCLIIYAYCASMLFQKLKTANTWFMLFNSLSGYLLVPVIIIFQSSSNKFLQCGVYLKYFLPFFDLVRLVFIPDSEEIDDSSSIQYTIMIYLLIFIFFQSKCYLRILNQIRQTQFYRVDENIKFQNVCKNYDKIQALKRVNFSVDDEKIALLGHNGAGKSTSFDILSCQLGSTSGNVFVEHQLRPNYKDVMESAGICYQNDTLWERMSPDEIVKVFSLICGIAEPKKQKQWFYNTLEFNYSNLNFENLSGGNKRKICMIVALMGSPKIKYLDECSTGLDPYSRFSMIKMIKQNNKGSIIFTTHSMSEVEEFCSRAIIMNKGEVIENEKIFKLKEKYLNVYRIEVKVREEGQIQSYFEEEEQNPIITQKQNKLFLIQILKKSKKLSNIIHHLHLLKEKRVIQYYRIDEPSLEDIYIMITRQFQDQQSQNDN